MLNSTIKEEVRNLTPSDQIDLIQYVLSLFKNDISEHTNLRNELENNLNQINEDKSSPGLKKNDEKESDDSLKSFLLSIAELGEEALRNGAPELPTDFATNHDYYLYGSPKR